MLSITPENMELLAMQIIDLLLEQNLMEDTVLYANGQSFYTGLPQGGVRRTTPGGNLVRAFPCLGEDIPGDFKNPDTVTATFEGNRMYREMNGGSGKLLEAINDLLSPYGLYLERGYDWNFYAAADD